MLYAEAEGLRGWRRIQIAEKDLKDISIAAVPTITLTVKARVTVPNANTSVQVVLQPEPGLNLKPIAIEVPLGGNAILRGLVPWSYSLIPNEDSPFYIKSMHLGDIDVLEKGLQIFAQPSSTLDLVIDHNTATISGRVTGMESVIGQTHVVLVPAPPDRHRIDRFYAVSPSSLGEFRLAGVAPGNYRAFALANALKQYLDLPGFIEGLEKDGIAVQVNAGESRFLETAVTIR
jgi:hypothetical protein